jgi:hypothetical protein
MTESKESLKTQEKILKDCLKFHESGKLKLWSFKADLLHMSQQKLKISEKIQDIEARCKAVDDKLLEYEYELEYLTETIAIAPNMTIMTDLKPWKIVLDICSGICKLIGINDTSWESFVVRDK